MGKEPEHKGFKAADAEDYITDPSTARAQAEAGQADTLGGRISRIRRAKGLSLEDLSSRTGLDVELLGKVERDEYTPPLGELIRIGKALEMKMGFFISPAASKRCTIVRAHQRQTVARFSSGDAAHHGYVYESLAPEKGDRKMEPFIVTMHPSDVQEMSEHDGQEFIHVLEGRMEALVGDIREVLEPGDSIYYDSDQPHLVRCYGQKPTKILAVLYTEER